MTGTDRDSDDGQVLVDRTYDETTPASIAVVYAVADVLDVDPVDWSEQGFTLFDHVDPEALDLLLTHDRRDRYESEAPITVELSLRGYLIRIKDTGRVRILDPDDSSTESDSV